MKRAAVVALATGLAVGVGIGLAPDAVRAQAAAPTVIRPSGTLGPPPATPAATGGGSGSNRGVAIGGGHPGVAPGATPGAPPVFSARGLPNRFRSVAKAETVLYDAPSDRARKVFIAPAGMPVEVISVLRDWVKFRDPLGDLAWVDRELLSDRRTVISTTIVSLRRDPRPEAPILFDADRGVLFELLEERPVAGFVKVRYQGNETGYLQADQVWGL